MYLSAIVVSLAALMLSKNRATSIAQVDRMYPPFEKDSGRSSTLIAQYPFMMAKNAAVVPIFLVLFVV